MPLSQYIHTEQGLRVVLGGVQDRNSTYSLTSKETQRPSGYFQINYLKIPTGVTKEHIGRGPAL